MQQHPESPCFTAHLRCAARQVEARLDTVLSPASAENRAESAATAPWPPHLLAAMRHGVLGGGKRLRPLLLLESTALFAAVEPRKRQSQMQAALECAAALECVHCYSLIHDDLPALDNDDWRRGRPTVHKAYDEATAILAGNALFSLAFQLLTTAENGIAAAQQAKLVYHLAQAAGAGGMNGGQMLDILAENQTRTAADIITLEMMKTGALLHFACIAGAILTEASAEDYARISCFGATIGPAFQLADDILDASATGQTLGKTAGKDAAAGKATLLTLYGLEKCRALLREKVEEAQAVLAPFGEKAEILRQTAQFIACRNA